jgi:cytochrome c-type biogenesis protein CcmH
MHNDHRFDPARAAPRSPRGTLARRCRGVLVACATVLALGSPWTAVFAKEAAPAAADPVLEKRMLALAAELRCLVCQNQTIADSSAPLAEDLRRQVREMLARGESDKQIIDFMTQRYGDFVLYRPPLKGTTAALWFGPFVLLVGGLAVFIVVLRRRSRLSADRFEPDELDGAPPAPR